MLLCVSPFQPNLLSALVGRTYEDNLQSEIPSWYVSNMKMRVLTYFTPVNYNQFAENLFRGFDQGIIFDR